jgi:uncharacterized membrane protein SpoIIM required for sporulation
MPSNDPDEMAADFVQLVDDLAYAKSFYPSGKVTHFINSQASKIYLDIYRNRKEESNRLITFWKYDVPLTVRKHYKVILFAFTFFVLFFTIGFFLSKDNEYLMGRMLGGDGGRDYIEETKERIRAGNPFGIYEGGSSVLAWLGIMVNNILVALRTFASGIAFGIPALYDLAKTGVMLGSFDQLFASQGLGIDFWLVVFVHGTLEITGFILVGAAGLILGKSFLFPGTIRRIDSLKQGAKDGAKLMIGLLPVFAIAAFFEGFVTRLYNNKEFTGYMFNTKIPWLTTGVVILSVLFVIWYFVIYPIRLGRKFSAQLNEEEV